LRGIGPDGKVINPEILKSDLQKEHFRLGSD